MRELTRDGSAKIARMECWAGDPMTERVDVNRSIYLSQATDALGERLPALERTIESEIVPRLMLMHHSPVALAPAAAAEELPGPEQIADFTSLILTQETVVARAYVEAMLAAGTSLETVYLHLLSPAARRLGVLWEEDHCGFADVTVGLWRLQQIVYEFEPAFRREEQRPRRGRRVLLVPAPGEQHTFGLFMVGEFFLRAGWDVRAELETSCEGIARMVREERFEIVGLSAGAEVKIDGLINCVRAVRRESRNRAVQVMVGGPIFLEKPELVGVVGADGTAMNARNAVSQAEILLGETELRC